MVEELSKLEPNDPAVSVLNRTVNHGSLSWLHKEIPRISKLLSSSSVSSAKKNQLQERKKMVDWFFETCVEENLIECSDH